MRKRVRAHRKNHWSLHKFLSYFSKKCWISLKMNHKVLTSPEKCCDSRYLRQKLFLSIKVWIWMNKDIIPIWRNLTHIFLSYLSGIFLLFTSNSGLTLVFSYLEIRLFRWMGLIICLMHFLFEAKHFSFCFVHIYLHQSSFHILVVLRMNKIKIKNVTLWILWRMLGGIFMLFIKMGEEQSRVGMGDSKEWRGEQAWSNLKRCDPDSSTICPQAEEFCQIWKCPLWLIEKNSPQIDMKTANTSVPKLSNIQSFCKERKPEKHRSHISQLYPAFVWVCMKTIHYCTTGSDNGFIHISTGSM